MDIWQVEFRDRLRSARNAALADSEGYLDLLHGIEELGSFLTRKKANGLAGYEPKLIELVSLAGLDSDGTFEHLLSAVRRARNDVAHLGAAARRLTTQATDVAVTLEEALMAQLKDARAEHYMVQGVACAEGWHTISMIRRTMLRSQFSALPFEKNNKWHLVTDSAVVRYCAGQGKLSSTLDEATSLELTTAISVGPDYLIEDLRKKDHGLVLVLDKNRLLGIIAPFDLL